VVLVFATVLLTMLKGLAFLATSNSFKTQTHLSQTGALYSAEAGFADVMYQLENDAGWTTGFSQKPLTESPGRYTVVFNTSGAPYKKTESVNNLQSDTTADSFLGEDTVPPYTALIIVQSEYMGRERTILATVSRGAPTSLYPGFIASGKIALRGDVYINGVEDLITGTATDAGIYSRQTTTGSPLITWEPNGLGDRAIIDSEVGVASTDPDTMDFGSNPSLYSVNNFKTDVSGLTNSVPDIQAEVSGKSGLPSPSLQPLGTTTISGGEFYQGGDVSLDGDLILDGGTLYVDGNLTVNGSIKGEGAVYVTGDSSFFGDAAVTAKSGDVVALYSKGDVKLSGFDGTAYLEAAVASDPQAQLWWDQTKTTVADMKGLINSNPAADFMGNTGSQGPVAQNLEEMRWALSDYSSIGVTQADTWKGHDTALLNKLATHIQSQPASSARDFILEKFLDLQKLVSIDDNSNPFNSGQNKAQIVANWKSGDRTLAGILDACASNGSPELMGELITLADQFSPDKLGSAFFRGVIYTNGFVYATSDVHIIGSMHTFDDGSQDGETIDGEDIEPGDIYLTNDTRLTYNQQFAEDAGLTSGSGELRVKTWVEL